ncbi:MAG: transposase [Candidatus Sericytochromatia bacterium]
MNEKTISRNYIKDNHSNIVEMNVIGIKEIYKENNKNILAFDASFIKKSGKKTDGLGKFWDGKNSKVTKGLELSLLAMIDTEYNTAYPISALQTDSNCENRMDFYLKHIENNKEYFKEIKHIAFDGFHSKKEFVDGIIKQEKHIICKLRSDANLNYLYQGERTNKKVLLENIMVKLILKNHKLDYVITLLEGEKLYSKVVYSLSLKRNIKIVLLLTNKDKRHIFYSSDLELSALDIFEFYSSRFQIEFLFRDSKTFTGLEDCQSTNKNILDTHFNMSFFAVNMAKVQDRITKGEFHKEPFSMLNYQRLASNNQMLKLFIHKFDIDLNSKKMAEAYKDMLTIGLVA